jgi:hypothetical protein
MKKIFMVLALIVAFYYTAKFFCIYGSFNAIYYYGKIDSDRYCKVWKKLNMCEIGTEGQCDGLYVPENHVIWKMILTDTFATFP